jgi:putative ABC transport system permease protein
VEAVGSTFAAPLGGSNVTGHLRDEGRPEPQPEDETSAGLRPSTREYLETMRIPVLRGRGLDPSDGRGAPHVALANERLVQEKLPH